jgi:hypothetical protein
MKRNVAAAFIAITLLTVAAIPAQSAAQEQSALSSTREN